MQSSTFLDTEDPVDALFHHYSLCPILLPPNAPVQTAYTAQVIASAPHLRLPTHLLAISPPPANPLASTILLPIDVNAYHRAFDNASFVPQAASPPALDNETLTLTLPVHPVNVPHGPSLALLLLFGLGLEADRNVLATHLLPPHAIAEFPNAAAMVGVVSHLRTTQFDFYWERNQGLWKNTLALVPRCPCLTELVPMTLKVVADAKKLRIRRW